VKALRFLQSLQRGFELALPWAGFRVFSARDSQG
jgi:hypothetical protein